VDGHTCQFWAVQRPDSVAVGADAWH